MVALLCLCLMVLFMLKQCSVEQTNPYGIVEGHSGGDTIDVAIEVSPLTYSLAGDTVSGLDYDMLRLMAEKIGRPVKFHPFAPLSFAMNGLEEGRFDMVVSSMSSTNELKSRFSMTNPLYIDRQVLVQLKEDADSLPPIVVQTDLAHDTVWVTRNSPFISRIRLLSDEIGDTIFVKEVDDYSSEHLFMLVAVGELPRAVVNDGIATKMAADYPLVDINTAISFSQFQSWALRKDSSELFDAVNDWIGEFKEEEEYDRLCRKYLK